MTGAVGPEPRPTGEWRVHNWRLSWIVVVVLAGCGEAGPAKFALSGSVAYDGQPVANGSLGLASVDGAGSQGIGADIVDGRYEIPAAQGPTAGKYRVWIEAERPSGKKIPSEDGSEPVDKMVQYIPPIYNVDSELVVDVDADRPDLDFNLAKPAGRSRRQ